MHPCIKLLIYTVYSLKSAQILKLFSSLLVPHRHLESNACPTFIKTTWTFVLILDNDAREKGDGESINNENNKSNSEIEDSEMQQTTNRANEYEQLAQLCLQNKWYLILILM